LGNDKQPSRKSSDSSLFFIIRGYVFSPQNLVIFGLIKTSVFFLLKFFNPKNLPADPI